MAGVSKNKLSDGGQLVDTSYTHKHKQNSLFFFIRSLFLFYIFRTNFSYPFLYPLLHKYINYT